MTQQNASGAPYPPPPAIRAELHYRDRVVGCFAHRPASIGDMLEAAVARWPDRTAITDETRSLSYVELAAEVEAVAGGLADLGVAPGERVALMLANSVEMMVALCAILRLGAIATPVNVREQAPELRRTLEHCGAAAILYEADLAERVPDRAHAPALKRVSVRGSASDAIPYAQLAASPRRVSQPLVLEEDVAVLLYTSGTTGKPKGAMLTHLSLISAALQYAAAADLTADDCAAVPAPMSHVTGLTGGLLPMLLVGGRVLSVREFKAGPYLQRIAEARASFMIMVPAMYALCMLQPEVKSLDLSAWRIGGYGGAPMAPALIERLAETLPNLRLINSYGSTETSGPQVLGRPESALRKAGAIGLPALGVEVLIMDERGRAVEPGETGEVWLRSGGVCRGYWNDAEATAAEFAAGFWKSGDIGRIDADGYLVLLDRKKDVINRGGYKVYSAEVEGALLSMPGVLEAAVAPYPCPVLGERVHAFITVAEDGAPDEETLRAHCAAHLADYKTPDRFTLSTTPLPRNANGKILKRTLALEASQAG